MPVYEYACKSCELELDTIHKMTETPEVRCPKCDAVMTRLISTIGHLSFRGRGFTPKFFPKK